MSHTRISLFSQIYGFAELHYKPLLQATVVQIAVWKLASLPLHQDKWFNSVLFILKLNFISAEAYYCIHLGKITEPQSNDSERSTFE